MLLKKFNIFLSKAHVNFPDEVTLGKALCETYYTGTPTDEVQMHTTINTEKIRSVLEMPREKNGYLSVSANNRILDELKIERAKEFLATNKEQALSAAQEIGFPLVMKVVGPVHKSDCGGVALNISSKELVNANFKKLMTLENAKAVILQKQHFGLELFIGLSYEKSFGHLLLMGLGGIFIEILGDYKVCLCPCTKKEILYRLKNLKAYPLMQGFRGQKGIDLEQFAEIILKISQLTQILPEIRELDINPLLAQDSEIIAVDMRVRV